MHTVDTALPTSVRRLEANGREVFLVATAHVSPASVEDVRVTLERVRPDVVCVELCAARHRTLTDSESWRQLDIFKVLREGKAALLLSSLLMSSFQRRIAKQLGVVPGAEMLAAIEWARASHRPLVLADRDIQITLKRTWSRLSLWRRLKMAFQLLASVFVGVEIDADTVEQLKESGELGNYLETLAQAFPTVKSTLIDERDVYLAQKIRHASGGRVVAVVGAGHVPGIENVIGADADLGPLDEVPQPSFWPTLLKWLIPIAIIGLVAYGFISGDSTASVTSIYLWLLINGGLAGLGALAALAHPLAILAAVLSAPLTSLNPMIAAGWVAGLVQAWAKRPTVADLEDLPEAITSLRGFWTNPVSRVLLVVALANLGSGIGTFVAGGLIAARTL